MESIYWNPLIETMPAQELKALQLERFKKTFGNAFHNSKAYRQHYDNHGITPKDIVTFEDIQKVPLIDKEFMSGTMDGSVYGSAIGVNEDQVVHFHQTSGTTAKPLNQPDTLLDWCWWSECWATVLWATGIRKGDRVMIAFGYGLFIGFWGAHYGCEKIGAEIISTGGLTSEQKIEKIRDLKVTAICATPTYIDRLTEAANEMGVDVSTLGVKRIICAGEPGALIPAVKTRMESAWNCNVYDHIGATEVGAWGYECDHGSGGMHVHEGMFLAELMELNSEQLITEPNIFGRVIITAFYRTGRPCVRFNTNDIACWQDGYCSCGRTFRLFKGGIQGRADHILKVRGTFVNPVIIEELIVGCADLSREYALIIQENGKDILLRVEAAQSIPSPDFESIRNKIWKIIYNKTYLNFHVEVMPFGTLVRSAAKSKRVIDLRKVVM